MKKYIDVDILIKNMTDRHERLVKDNGYYDHYTQGCEDALDTVENEPTVDIKAEKHGVWLVEEMEDEAPDCYLFTCSVCGRNVFGKSGSGWHEAYTEVLRKCPYCHCGAKMDGVRRSEL